MAVEIDITINNARHISQSNSLCTLFSTATATVEHIQRITQLSDITATVALLFVSDVLTKSQENHSRCSRVFICQPQLRRKQIGQVNAFLAIGAVFVVAVRNGNNFVLDRCKQINSRSQLLHRVKLVGIAIANTGFGRIVNKVTV